MGGIYLASRFSRLVFINLWVLFYGFFFVRRGTKKAEIIILKTCFLKNVDLRGMGGIYFTSRFSRLVFKIFSAIFSGGAFVRRGAFFWFFLFFSVSCFLHRMFKKIMGSFFWTLFCMVWVVYVKL